MSSYFRPYEGSEPYIFVSYSHADSQTVLETINRLREEKYRIWYDEGIPAGSDWPRSVQRHLKGSDTVLFFLSKESMKSPNCHSEMVTAKQLGKRRVYISLGGAEPDAKWQEALEGAEKAAAAGPGFEEYLKGEYERIEYVVDKSRNRRGLIAMIISLAVLAGSVYGAMSAFKGRFTPETETPEVTATPAPTPKPEIDIGEAGSLFKTVLDFPDRTQEEAVRRVLGIYEGDIERPEIKNISRLCICGRFGLPDGDGIAYDPESGSYTVNSTATKGEIKNLSFISGLSYLEELTLVQNEIEDINQLSGLKLLRRLAVAGNPVSSLEGISGFISLEELNIEHTDIRDLSPLSALPGLKKVTVSADMLPLIFDSGCPFEVILVE